MGFRFWRRIKILPGVTLNLSKSGGSLSFGPKGAKFTIGPKGKRTTVGMPGTGLFYTKIYPKNKSEQKNKAASSKQDISQDEKAKRLTLSFFKRLTTPDEEKALINGCKEMILGDENSALTFFKQSAHLADGAYLAGFLSLKKGLFEEAADYLKIAKQNHDNLGRYLSKYGIQPTLSLSITDEISAQVGVDLRGTLLGLVEANQSLKQWYNAIHYLEILQKLEPDDMVVELSFAELLLNGKPDDKDVCQRVLTLIGNIDNYTPIHTALMLYKAKALRCLGLEEAAADILTTALRKKKERPEELLRAIRYERALAYEKLGRKKRALNELEKLYADDPNYEDVAVRLGLKN